MAMDVARAGRSKHSQRTLSDTRAFELSELAMMPLEDQCYFLYCKGYTYRQIAGMLTLDKNTVMKRVHKAAAALRPTEEERETWVTESVESLRQVKAAAWSQFAQNGNDYMLTVIYNAEERIARVRGLIDSGKSKIEVSGPNGGSIPVEFSARAAFAAVASGSAGDRPDAE